MEDLKKVQEFFSKPMGEATKEDPTDIIAMDVPLFLRMLEWAKEEAAEDVDLHKVTERAIEAVKLRGLLSMDDYNDLIGESIEEETGYSKYLATPENPKGKTPGLTPDIMSKILMKIADPENIDEVKKKVKEVLLEKKKKRDRCLRIADRKFKKPSAYKSAAAVRCRQGEIWKNLK
jgi:hypothetical protein